MPLCRLRRFLGLTQADVETATGISTRRLSLAEHGSLKLTASEEAAVSEYLADRLRIVRELETVRCDHPPSQSASKVFHAAVGVGT